MRQQLSVVIIAANVESTIKDCLISCKFAHEVILITNATDKTIPIAKATIPTIKIFPSIKSGDYFNFSEARNLGLKYVTKDWVLYLDDDERISPKLKAEIIDTIGHPGSYTNFDLPRANYFLGHRVKNGGTYPDYVKRLFIRKNITGYREILHEQPIVTGDTKKLKSNLIHLTHRTLKTMLEKSIIWTSLEAKLIHKTDHPPVVWWRFIRMMFTKLWERLIVQNMWRDGIVGWISVIFEVFDTFMIYAQLYELQLKKDA